MSRSLGVLTLDLIARTGGFESGMDKAARVADKKTREIERQARERAKAIDDAFTKMGAGIAAAWTTLNVVQSVKGAADLADQLSKLSQRTGVAVERLSALNYAAGLNDATLEDLSGGLKGLANKMLEAQAGSADAVAAFDALGVKATTSAGKLRPVEAVMLDIADAFSKMEDGAGKSALANKLMEESGIKLIPTLNNGRAGLEAMRIEAEALGGIMRDDLANASVQLNDNLARMQTMAQGLAASIGNDVIPSLNEMASEFLNARRAGLSFMEALTGIGLSDPTKAPAEHIARLVEEIDKLENGHWFERSLFGNLSKDKTLEQKRKELEYWRLELLEGGTADPRDRTAPPQRTAAPALPTTPKATPKSKPVAYEDPLADSAKAYADAMQFLNRAQIDADTSGLKLTATQARLVEVMADPSFTAMPESWRLMVVEQAEYALQAEKTAEEQARLNELIAATPTAQLEAQRGTMAFLAQAFEQGRISAEQFSEAASTALGNIPADAKPAMDSFVDLAKIAQDGAKDMAGAFVDYLFDPMDQNIADMLSNFLKAIAKMIAQQAILNAMKNSSIFGGLFADGGAFNSSGQISAFASGGVVNQPTFFKFASGGSFQTGVMGEAGPEAILPLKRGADGKLGVTLNGAPGGSTIVNITVNDNGQTTQDGGTGDAAQLAQKIKGVVLQVLVTEKRPGGLLTR